MSAQMLTLELSGLFAVPETELIRKGLLALIEKEIRLAETEIEQREVTYYRDDQEPETVIGHADAPDYERREKEGRRYSGEEDCVSAENISANFLRQNCVQVACSLFRQTRMKSRARREGTFLAAFE